MSLSRYALRTAGFAALYLAAVFAGRATAVDGVHLLWPAAAVAAVWLVAQARYRLRRFDVIALATMSVSIGVLNHGLLGALAGAVPQVAPAALFAVLLNRWVPGYWRGHGDRFRRQGRALARLVAAAATAGLTGAVLHSVVLTTGLPALDAGYVLLRDTTAVLLAVLLARTARQRLTGRSEGPGLSVVR